MIISNHIYAIIIIGCREKAEWSRPFPKLSTIVGLYKSGVSKRIQQICPDIEVWQKSFYDEIIRICKVAGKHGNVLTKILFNGN